MRSLHDTLPPHRVILHNDDVNTQDHVVHALISSVPGISRSRALEIMFQAHKLGHAQVVRCPLELAELYQERLASFGLTATIERA